MWRMKYYVVVVCGDYFLPAPEYLRDVSTYTEGHYLYFSRIAAIDVISIILDVAGKGQERRRGRSQLIVVVCN